MQEYGTTAMKRRVRCSLCYREPRLLERGADAAAEDDLGASPRPSAYMQTLGGDGCARYCAGIKQIFCFTQ